MMKETRLKYFPISFFSMILGLAGLSIAFQRAEKILGLKIIISPYLLGATSFLFALFLIVYILKLICYFSEVKKEFNNPIKLSFFPTISISFLLLSTAFISINTAISKILWILGTLIHFIFTLRIISIWIHHEKFQINHMNPAWFIPAVGNIIVPITGTEFFPLEISWFFYSIGIVFWLILMIVFFNRIIFHNPMPDKLLPTLFLLIAPPAVGFIAFVKLSGGLDPFAKILYYFAAFMFILLLTQLKLFSKIKFYLSWWAYSFPLAAFTIASILMFHESGLAFFRFVALALFYILNIVIIGLLIKTAHAMLKYDICVNESE